MRNHCLLPGPGAGSTVKTVGEHITGSTPYSLRSVMCTLGMCIVVRAGTMATKFKSLLTDDKY